MAEMRKSRWRRKNRGGAWVAFGSAKSEKGKVIKGLVLRGRDSEPENPGC